MKKVQGLSGKERAKHLALCVLYPFLLLYGGIKKFMKLFVTKRKQIAAGITSAALILAMMPTNSIAPMASTVNAGSMQQSDVLTVQSAATGETDFKQPKLGVGIKILPENSKSAVYFGSYPQNSSKATDKSPIKWLTTAKERENDVEHNLYFTSQNAITMISEKVLDVTKWVDFKKSWKVFDRKWLVMYSESKLFNSEKNFASNAFNSIETAAITKGKVVTYGGFGGAPEYGPALPGETTEELVYSPYYVQGGDSSNIFNDPGFHYDAEATPYAVSKGLINESHGAEYWLRKPVVGGNNYESYTYMHHIVKRGNIGIPTYSLVKDQTLGMRPLTRVKGENLILVSQVDQKDNSVIVNEEIPSDIFPEYELTLLDSSRTFTASAHGQEIQGNNWVIPVTYQNAKTGANEYISYTLIDANDNVLEYRRVKASDSESGAFNVSVPMSVLTGYTYKLNVFNEQITPGYYCDYASPVSQIVMDIPRSKKPESETNQIMQAKNGTVEYFDLILKDTSGFYDGQWKIYTEPDYVNEFPMESMSIQYGNRLRCFPLNREMPTGTYYVTFNEEGKLPSAPIKIEVIAYINKKVGVHFYQSPGQWYDYRVLEEGGDLTILNVPKKGYVLINWEIKYDIDKKFSFSYPGKFNLDVLADLAATNPGGVLGLNSYLCSLYANYLPVTAPVVNTVSLS